MPEEAATSDGVTPEQFFEQLMPMGFAAQASPSGAPAPDFTIQFCLTGAGGGEWHAAVSGGAMQVSKGRADANLTVTLGVDDWRDAVLARNGATLGIILPRARPEQPASGEGAKALKGTMAFELARPEVAPFRFEMCFNNTGAPKATLHMTLTDYVDMQEGREDGQQLFLQGRIRVEGDMLFLMQLASLSM